MKVPMVWEGLRGTLGVQLAQLREHIETLPIVVGSGKARVVFELTPARKAKMLAKKAEDRYMHPVEALAAEFGVPVWRINEWRTKFRAEAETCAS